MKAILPIRSLTLFLAVALSALAFDASANPEDFSLRSATGRGSFKLSESRGKFVALHFLLKTECPHCLRHTQTYFANADKLPNVVQVFIKPDTENEISAWASKLPADELAKNPIYRDPDAKLTKAFGIPDGYQFHGQLVYFPATILIGPDGKEVFRHVGKSNADRYSFDQLTEKVAELSR